MKTTLASLAAAFFLLFTPAKAQELELEASIAQHQEGIVRQLGGELTGKNQALAFETAEKFYNFSLGQRMFGGVGYLYQVIDERPEGEGSYGSGASFSIPLTPTLLTGAKYEHVLDQGEEIQLAYGYIQQNYGWIGRTIGIAAKQTETRTEIQGHIYYHTTNPMTRTHTRAGALYADDQLGIHIEHASLPLPDFAYLTIAHLDPEGFYTGVLLTDNADAFTNEGLKHLRRETLPKEKRTDKLGKLRNVLTSERNYLSIFTDKVGIQMIYKEKSFNAQLARHFDVPGLDLFGFTLSKHIEKDNTYGGITVYAERSGFFVVGGIQTDRTGFIGVEKTISLAHINWKNDLFKQ